jgi:hypothetical protein
LTIGRDSIWCGYLLWETMSTTRACRYERRMNGLLEPIVLTVVVVVGIQTWLMRDTVHVWLAIWLALVTIRHGLGVGILRLLMHCCGRHGWTTILSVWRVLLHSALGLESRRHSSTGTHVLVRDRSVRLRRMAVHVGVVVLRREPTATAALWGIATVHGVAHVAMGRLRGLASQVLSLGERVVL